MSETKFPHLPVLGHVPKKRKENLTKTLTLEQIRIILDKLWLDGDLSDWANQCIWAECKKAAAK